MRCRFDVVETVGLEAQLGNYLYDLNGLRLDIFVKLQPKAFNQAAGAAAKRVDAPERPYCEISGALDQAYVTAKPQYGHVSVRQVTEAEGAEAEAAFHASLASFGELLHRSGDLDNLVRFVRGFVHNEHVGQLPSASEIVDAVAIRDNDVTLWTRTIQWHLRIRVRLRRVYVDTETGGEELKIAVRTFHSYSGVEKKSPPRRYSRRLPAQRPFSDRPTASTPWETIVVVPFDNHYIRDAAGNRVQSTDVNGIPATFTDSGQPCYRMHSDKFSVGVEVLIVEQDVGPDEVLQPGWARREVQLFLRRGLSSAEDIDPNDCGAEGDVERMVRLGQSGVVHEYTEVVEFSNAEGSYLIVTEAVLEKR